MPLTVRAKGVSLSTAVSTLDLWSPLQSLMSPSLFNVDLFYWLCAQMTDKLGVQLLGLVFAWSYIETANTEIDRI